MKQIVINHNGQAVTTSRLVAQTFGKWHKIVLRTIRESNSSEKFKAYNYIETTYVDKATGKEYPEFIITRDGFTFLAMGFTGAKAAKFKENYIHAFNHMDAELKGRDMTQLSRMDILQMAVNAERERLQLSEKAKTLQEKTEKQQLKIDRLQPKAEHYERIIDMGDLIDIGQAAKILGLPYGRNTLFKKLREVGVLFTHRNEPKQQYIDRGLFEVKEKEIQTDHRTFMTIKVLVTQKGLAYLGRLLGAETEQRQMALIN